MDEIGAVGRMVTELGDDTAVVALAAVVPGGVEEVWEACTSAERLPLWFLPVSGELKVGGRYSLEGNASGTVERCEAPNVLAVTWEFGGAISRVTLMMSAQEGGTRFELDHRVGMDPHWAEYGPGAVGIGWDMALRALFHHLEGVPHEDISAWASSPEGREFLTRSGEEWGEAHAAGGVDAVRAKELAARTIAAYTGDA